jgi:mono/diheme cytochrome c family protein
VKRTLLVAAAVVLGIPALLAAWVVWSNANLLDRRFPVERVTMTMTIGTSDRAGSVARGKALSDVTGCTDCHAADLRGSLFIDEGWLRGRYYASNLTLKAQQYSDEDMVRIVRHGVLPDGRGVVQMPSMGFVRITDDEMADIVAFIRSVSPGGPAQPDHYIGPLDQWALWRGIRFRPAISYVQSERTRNPPDAGPQHAVSQHLVGIVCAECHGGDLKGNGWDTGAPDLRVVASYGLAEFTRLLRTGIGAGGKELGLMTIIARSRLHRLSDEQIVGMHGYLIAASQLARN